ncbi:MAG: hypothetical protein E7517_03060 [Ruminococcaceae bacterium]|nr:hypothetical protein [Oscillospiraceae bacterium]
MCFSIGQVRVEISFLFCILLSCLVLFDSGLFLAAFIMVCAHECAHLFAMYLCGVHIDSVELEPFGILIKKERKALAFSRQMCIIFAGCFANLFLAVISIILHCFFSEKSIFLQLFFINAALAFFNLLPITGLDGGQALQLFLSRYKCERFALNTGKTVSCFCCVLLFALGMIMSFKVRLNPSLCFFSLFLLIQTFTARTQSN